MIIGQAGQEGTGEISRVKHAIPKGESMFKGKGGT